MCGCHPPVDCAPESGGGLFSRRQAVTGAAVIAAAFGRRQQRSPFASAAPGVATMPVQVAPGFFVRPRNTWGADLAPKAPPVAETPQFLLVHHTASPNDYGIGGPLGVIRSVYRYHTSPDKGWPDVCYEFFIDHDGVVYEGRAGSLAGPVRADATGGSQGFAQLVCLLGDFSIADPTAAMVGALVKTLAWLADRYSIDTAPGATTSFVSRGSQRHRAGVSVTTSTIAGHRDMSYTVCPGDGVYQLFDALRPAVHAQRVAWQSAMYQAQRLG